ncbi:hypothetical protein GGE45_006021, partial [Rhizobium aethiopicum]
RHAIRPQSHSLRRLRLSRRRNDMASMNVDSTYAGSDKSERFGMTVGHSAFEDLLVGANLGSVPVVQRETEMFFRTTSDAQFQSLLATGRVSATVETFISTEAAYARYSGVTVQFMTKGGTKASLAQMGVGDASRVVRSYDLPSVAPVWTASRAFFKSEDGVLIIGLGRGAALDLFNRSIIDSTRCLNDRK